VAWEGDALGNAVSPSTGGGVGSGALQLAGLVCLHDPEVSVCVLLLWGRRR
jgi:hypothetical protein